MKIESADLVFGHGLVRIPVQFGLVAKTERAAFVTLHAACSTPIKQRKWCPTCDVEALDTVKGVKLSAKEYRPVPDERVEVTKAEKDRTVVLTKFVPAADTAADFVVFRKHYYLMPGAATDGYAMLVATMKKKKLAAVGTTTMWGKEHPLIVRVHDGGLMLSLSHVADDVNERPIPPPTPLTNQSMLALAAELVDKQAGRLEPEDLASETRERRERLLADVLGEAQFIVDQAGPPPDLMESLKLAVAAANSA